jgi:phage gp16-like protein
MSNNSDLIKKISDLISDRSVIWSRYDEAIVEAQKLDQYQQFNNPNVPLLSSSLSQTKTPPDEIASVNWQLQQESQKIAQSKNNIEKYQAEIAETQKQFWIVVGIAIFIIFIFLISLFK